MSGSILRSSFSLGSRALALGLVTAAAVALPETAAAQTLNVDLGTGAGLTERVVQLVGLLTVLSLAPSIVIMTTSFVRITVVLSLLRTALGLQQMSEKNSMAGTTAHLLRLPRVPVSNR
jgi:flagellar biosynthesis protein FliP